MPLNVRVATPGATAPDMYTPADRGYSRDAADFRPYERRLSVQPFNQALVDIAMGRVRRAGRPVAP